MTQSGKVDQDAVLRARTILLGTGRISLRQQIWAYRVLAQESPVANLPKLAEALLSYGNQELEGRPQAGLAAFAEAVGAARRLEESDRRRPELLVRALNAYQRQLFELGRRREGIAVCEEMAGLGRRAFAAGQLAGPGHGPGRLAAVLAEEGRHPESARLFGETVAAERDRAAAGDVPFWSLAAWAAQLDAAGEPDRAVEVLTELVAATRAELAEDRTSPAILVWELIRLAQLLDGHGRPEPARAARAEAAVLLAELAETGERRSWSNIQSWWTTLLGVSARVDELPVPGEPGPAFGSPVFAWSPDVRQAYFEGRAALEAGTAALAPLAAADPGSHLADLVVLQRRLTIRSALYWQSRTYRIQEPLQGLFDEGVALARRLTEVDAGQGRGMLARALVDRSAFSVAVQQYGEAFADFQEASGLLDR
ncbi:MAG TPA: hypothetical protein VGX23_31235 [Actinocrinis sp.]|nr:hypothetical protein [Actinocrinis sp.]